MIEVDQPQHLCRREPEHGDEALEASPDLQGVKPHLAMKSTLSSGVQGRSAVLHRQQQCEDRMRSRSCTVDDRGPTTAMVACASPTTYRIAGASGSLPIGMESVATLLRLGASLLTPHTDATPSRETTTRLPVTRSSRPHAAFCWAARTSRSVAKGVRAQCPDIQGDAVGAKSCACRFGLRAVHGDREACIGGQLRTSTWYVDAQHHLGGVESRHSASPDGRVSSGGYGGATGTVVPRDLRTFTVSRPSASCIRTGRWSTSAFAALLSQRADHSAGCSSRG